MLFSRRAPETGTPSRLEVHFELRSSDGEDPATRALAVALEQTVELQAATVPPEAAGAIGRVESVQATDEPRVHRALISYDPEIAGPGFGQLVNLLFGNVSMQPGTRIVRVGWPRELLSRLPGPRFGITGLRDRIEVRQRRPLVCAALKPLGLDSVALAGRARALARGKVDIVKDDHSLADQRSAPFRERVERCLEAVADANRHTRGSTAYFPHLSGGPEELVKRVEWLRSVGCRGVMVSPMTLGFEAVSWLARNSGLAILGHPSLTGAFFAPDHGIAPEILLGQIFRAAGCDGVIYPNVGGRFAFSLATCEAINRNLRAPLGAVRKAIPVPGGGIDRRRVPLWVSRYGPDTVFLIGGSLYAAPHLETATRELVEGVRAMEG